MNPEQVLRKVKILEFVEGKLEREQSQYRKNICIVN